ncbi:bis-aminopropyl spermidine synthase family protein [Candidatus Woesearchaeota archaeon]|nr:bis-aminopropyl spermidine synthase family protein [Candidatus Woesearchaeota archaeon]
MERQEFQVIRMLKKGPSSFWRIAAEIDGTLLSLFSTLESLQKSGTIYYEDQKFSLSENADASFMKDNFDKEFAEFRKLAEARPPALLDFFQAPLTDNDVFKRLSFIYDLGDLAGKEFFILGDDDLFSIALALTGMPKRIVVAEVDARISEMIERISKEQGLDIEVITYDCARPLPADLQKSFDVFICDPVETLKGFTVFISRGISSLRHPGSMYFGLTELECPAQNWHAFQRMILDSGMVITDIKRRFSYYSEDEEAEDTAEHDSLKLVKKAPFTLSRPDQDWYNSSYIRCQTIAEPKPELTGNIEIDDSFYDDEFVLTKT